MPAWLKTAARLPVECSIEISGFEVRWSQTTDQVVTPESQQLSFNSYSNSGFHQLITRRLRLGSCASAIFFFGYRKGSQLNKAVHVFAANAGQKCTHAAMKNPFEVRKMHADTSVPSTILWVLDTCTAPRRPFNVGKLKHVNSHHQEWQDIPSPSAVKSLCPSTQQAVLHQEALVVISARS